MNTLGMPTVSLSPMGGGKVLLQFGSIEIMNEWRKSGYLEQWFQVTHEWYFRVKNHQRWTWLIVEGVPLHTWCDDTFSRITSYWGDVIMVHPSTSSMKDLEKGMVLVEIPLETSISMVGFLKFAVVSIPAMFLAKGLVLTTLLMARIISRRTTWE